MRKVQRAYKDLMEDELAPREAASGSARADEPPRRASSTRLALDALGARRGPTDQPDARRERALDAIGARR